MDVSQFILIMAILFIMFIAAVSIIIKAIKAIKNGKKEEKLKNKEMKRLGQLEKGTFSLMTGLPIAEKTMCEIIYYTDKIQIISGGQTFNISFNKITNMVITTNVEIQKQYVSSVGGAVGGAVIFGPLGAIVGGRAKEKSSKQIYKYLVITYMNKDDNIDYISFDVTYNLKANDFISLFNKQGIKHEGKVTEL